MTPYRALIEQEAARVSDRLDPNLVEAVVIAESNGCTDAFRYEAGFFRLYLANNPDYKGENPRRVSSSYGLMQVMYPTARQYGFGEVPELLFIPDVGLHYGCRHLAAMLAHFTGDIASALAAYNGGIGNYTADAPQRYARRVYALYLKVQQAHPRAIQGAA